MYKTPPDSRQASLFWDLETMLDPNHPLFMLANMIDWRGFEKAFSPLYCADNCRSQDAHRSGQACARAAARASCGERVPPAARSVPEVRQRREG